MWAFTEISAESAHISRKIRAGNGFFRTVGSDVTSSFLRTYIEDESEFPYGLLTYARISK